MSFASLLPILVPAPEARTLPLRLAEIVEKRLRRFGIDAKAIEAEKRAMHLSPLKTVLLKRRLMRRGPSTTWFFRNGKRQIS